MKRRPYPDDSGEEFVIVDGHRVFSDLAPPDPTVYYPFDCPACGKPRTDNGFCNAACNDKYARDLAAADAERQEREWRREFTS